MDLSELLKELSALKEQMKEIRDMIARLEQGLLGGEMELHRCIKARRIQIHRQNPDDDLIFSPDASAEELTLLYELLKRYSFRLFLRDVINKKDVFRAQDLVRYCSLEAVEWYIDFLCQLRLAEMMGKESFCLRKQSLFSFGPTLEWFVSQMFQREFASAAMFGVRFKDTCSGGDYDVIALWQGRLVYVEIKSSPPRGIEREEIGSFFARLSDLLPDIAFLFNDTQLRMKDKVVPMFEEELSERFGASNCDRFPVHRLVDELFHVNHRIYIVNSKRDVVDNFNLCLRDFLFHQRLDLFPIMPPHAD
jgi:hypothetical protein